MRVGRARDVLWRRTSGGGVVLLVAGQSPFHVSGAGGVLWQLLDTPLSTEAAIVELADLYRVPTAVVAPEVKALVDELLRRGALAMEPVS